MRTGAFLHDLVGSIFDRAGVQADRPPRSLADLCLELISNRDETESLQIAKAVLDTYEAAPDADRLAFFTMLAAEWDLDARAVEELSRQYRRDPSAENFDRLTKSAQSQRARLLRLLIRARDATQRMVGMRNDLLRMSRDHPALGPVDADFVQLFGMWFDRALLEMRPISWDTSAEVLSKIIRYEAVHSIEDWDDLRRRVQPSDRRCFAFFHPTMPNEPIVFVAVALCNGVPGSIQDILSDDRNPQTAEGADTAAFYSISNCLPGLQGIPFGNSLIKQVVVELSAAHPNLKSFVTLSPLPKFAHYVARIGNEAERPLVDTLLEDSARAVETGDLQALTAQAGDLTVLAARYLVEGKRENGQPLDPVARFHLRNGASVDDLHALADTSEKGLQNALNVMVTYRYDTARLEENRQRFLNHGVVARSSRIDALLSPTAPGAQRGRSGRTLRLIFSNKE